MQTAILLPDLGISPAILSVWYAERGEFVQEGDRVAEILVGGATFDVSAPSSGWLSERLAFVNQQLSAGEALGLLSDTQHP
jgi:pyruvate/2-oxoglutarate dehydrogenase complex dihydrolipoamide acyltransferase (E2) component